MQLNRQQLVLLVVLTGVWGINWPVASTLSVMMIPVLGVFSGALWLGEVLHWQDWAAVLLMVVAIASVLAPSRAVVKC